MHPLSAAALLDIWDAGQGRPPTERALLLLEAACAEAGRDEIARWSVGWRDGRLLTLREHLFGVPMQSVTACPACGERLELDFATTDIRAPVPEAPPLPRSMLSLALDGYAVTFRLPDSRDLRAAGAADDAAAIARRLLDLCIVGARYGGEAVGSEDLPDTVVAEINRRLAGADPQADPQLALTCPACGHAWRAPLDIGAFLWAEVEAWAARTLHGVHRLATAYGWREADILALSPRRRQFYLDLVSA